MKGIKVTRCKGKRNHYKGLRKKQERNKREEGEASEKGGEATNDLVQHLTRKNGRSPHTSQENASDEEASPLHKSREGDQKESGEDRLDDVEVPSHANLEDGKNSSEKYRMVCQENTADEEQLEEAGPLQMRGEDDKRESCDDRWCDAEAPSLDDGQTSSENEHGVCKENVPEEEVASLTKNVEVDDTIFDEVSCATSLRDAEEWSDDQSDIAATTIKSPTLNKRKPTSSSSCSSTIAFRSSKSRKRRTKHQSKRRTVLFSSDEEEHSPERFYQNHHKKLKSLLPKHLPNRGRFMIFCAWYWPIQVTKIQEELTFTDIRVIHLAMNVLFADRLLQQPSPLSKLAR